MSIDGVDLFDDSYHEQYVDHLDLTDVKIRDLSHLIAANHTNNKSGYSATGGVKVEWGPKKETSITTWGETEYHDKRGNQVKIEVNRNQDGNGNATVSGKHSSDFDEDE